LRLELGARLAKPRRGAPHGLATSMIDTSDGLSTDLGNICAASGVGARIFAERIPAVQVPAALSLRGFSAANLALHGGEDYELVFTVPKKLARLVPKTFGGVPLTHIGDVTKSRAIVLVDESGGASVLKPRGWDHFRGKK
jgi:thiamine-monophosphate kinase